MLVSAARPALLLESLEQGEPRLAVTLAATLDQLRERSEGARAVCDETRASLTPQGLVGDVPATTVTALRALVEDLPAYRR
jgi:hypothetical protein